MADIKVKLFMAMSLNGMVARDNDSEDFLPHYGWDKFVELATKAGGFIIGRRTYSVVRENYKNFGFDYLDNLTKIVISNKSQFDHSEDILIASGIEKSLEIAKKQGLKEVILTGGPTINSQFAQKNLIDEIIFNLEPVVIGKGRSVFSNVEFDLKLKPLTVEKHIAGGYTLYYKVIR